ncbi:type II toxin-antitoxin system VapC family toxin [Afifella aestuarii]|uniref:type II toxin-antitoxin system VapC family toxin n=1 Tax=Afifella aestuarii TaxID=1909496 RepID=UPI000FE43E57|nr:type II toxin-antitoxin system VapC family toxin [Afifella aestuarii]
MIVIDTSVLAAIYLREPDGRGFFECIARSTQRILPATCVVEFLLLRRYGGDRRAWLDRLIRTQDIRVEAFTAAMAAVAAEAAEKYGRGSGHPAELNFGDCLSYAIAKHLGAPLLYKGGDFSHTDIESAFP